MYMQLFLQKYRKQLGAMNEIRHRFRGADAILTKQMNQQQASSGLTTESGFYLAFPYNFIMQLRIDDLLRCRVNTNALPTQKQGQSTIQLVEEKWRSGIRFQREVLLPLSNLSPLLCSHLGWGDGERALSLYRPSAPFFFFPGLFPPFGALLRFLSCLFCLYPFWVILVHLLLVWQATGYTLRFSPPSR